MRLAIIVLSYLWAGTEIYLSVRQRKGVQARTRRDRGSLSLLFVAITLAFSIGFPVAASPWGRLDWARPVMEIAGLVGIMAGALLRGWAIATLKSSFTFSVCVTDNQEIVTRGPYRLIRHPGYLGSLLILLGIGVGMSNWISLALFLFPPLLAFLNRISVEEQAMAAAFPPYRQYMRQSRKLLPWIY